MWGEGIGCLRVIKPLSGLRRAGGGCDGVGGWVAWRLFEGRCAYGGGGGG